MSSSFPIPNPISGPLLDEQSWIIYFRRTIDEEDHDESYEHIPVSIFDVPKTLKLLHPDSYAPQLLSIGPYHHSRPELHEIGRYKISSAKRLQKLIQPLKFQNLVDYLTKFDPAVRACYHKQLHFYGETLTWIMAVDSCFLLEFLGGFAVKEEKALFQMSLRMSHLIDMSGRKSGHNAIVKDIVMLENQIPLFLLRAVLEYQLGSVDAAENKIYSMLMGFCKGISPLNIFQDLPSVHQVMTCAHLLDLLYHLIVPKSGHPSESSTVEDEGEAEMGEQNNSWNIIPKLKQGPVSLIRSILMSKPVKLIFALPCKIISNLPVVVMVKQFEYFCFSQENENKSTENGIWDTPPLMEEIAIPSVTELSTAGIKFSATNSGISSIEFDAKIATFYLPIIKLDSNSEVVLRNMVAYEACNASGPLFFTRYTELMNGIIDDKEDAKILRERGIILNHLKSDEDVANLWNGMTKSIRLTKVPLLDKTIGDVNLYYNGRLKVRIGKFMARHVFGSWRHLTFIAAVLIFFFMSMQVFSFMFSWRSSFLHHRRMN